MKSLSAICLLYLLSGATKIPVMLSGEPVFRVLGTVYAACTVLALLGVIAAFRNRPGASRCLTLWAIGVAALLYATPDLVLAFPTFLPRFPVSFGVTQSTGNFARVGVDLVPGFLYGLVWVIGSRAAKQAPPKVAADQA